MSGEATLKAKKGGWPAFRLLALALLIASGVLLFCSSNRATSPLLCEIDLPFLAHDNSSRLLSDATALLEDEELLPFEQLGWPVIPDEETSLLNKVTPKDENDIVKFQCGAATYGTYPLRLLASGWKGLRRGDVLVDLGAGTGYVLAAAALLTNSSGRGIELSPTRARKACEALTDLSSVLTKGRSTIGAKAIAPVSEGLRHFSIWQADLFQPPPSLWEAPRDPARQLTVFSYVNCFSDSFIQSIMKTVAKLPHPNVRLMISKLPRKEELIPTFGLRRVTNPGIHTFEKSSGG